VRAPLDAPVHVGRPRDERANSRRTPRARARPIAAVAHAWGPLSLRVVSPFRDTTRERERLDFRLEIGFLPTNARNARMAPTRALLSIASLLSATALHGCPVDDRTLYPATGGTFVVTAGESGGGESGASGGGAGGDDEQTGGVGGSNAGEAGNSGSSGRGGTSGTSGTNGNGGSGGATGGTGGIGGCRGSRCSCSGDDIDECAGNPCCRTLNVPTGSFTLGAGESSSASASLEGFGLDQFEVTVGRFRKFVDSYTGAPQPDAGQHPFVVASGWQSPWDALIAADTDSLGSELGCHPTQATWTDDFGPNEARPMNCVTWFEAFAFCAWDGGRLPTEAEWEYAASGGDSPREFPWGDDAPTPDLSLYACNGMPLDECTATDLLSVGSRPDGAGRFLHEDLAGSLGEWVLDWHAPYADPCNNCANVDGGSERVTRGGSFLSERVTDLRARARAPEGPTERFSSVGFRCARDE
jgi:sulfatase modifying factor 1